MALLEVEEEKLSIDKEEEKLSINKDEEKLSINKEEEKLSIDKEEEKLSINKDEEKLSINKEEEKKSIDKEEEKLLIDKEEEKLAIDEKDKKFAVHEKFEKLTNDEKEENLERAVQLLCCTAIRDACVELIEESIKGTSLSAPIRIEKTPETKEKDQKIESAVQLLSDQAIDKKEEEGLEAAVQLLDQEKADEKWLERTALILSSNAIREACSELIDEMVPSCDTLSGQNIHLPYVSIRDAVTGCDENDLMDQAPQQPMHQEEPSIEEAALENGIEQKVIEREEKMENFHEEEKNNDKKEQTQRKAKKGWKARGKRAARRLGRAVRRLLTSCFRCKIAP
ncbi:uncharacterized protein LOC144917699 [Branchiostoma floridae x Branchiostoma belcheri]